MPSKAHTSNTDAQALNMVISEVMTIAAYDTLGDLKPSEQATLKRELGDDWQAQLLTPVVQPLTLRSGRMLVGGGCSVAFRYFARVVLTTWMVMSLMAMLVPYVPATLAASNQMWVGAQAFARTAWNMSQSCPVGFGQTLTNNMMCGKFAQLLEKLHYATWETLQQISQIFAYTATGVASTQYVMTRVYAFVRSFVTTGDATYVAVLDWVCDALSKRPPASTATKKPAMVADVTDEQARQLTALLEAMAVAYRQQTQVKGGAFAIKKSRRGRPTKSI